MGGKCNGRGEGGGETLPMLEATNLMEQPQALASLRLFASDVRHVDSIVQMLEAEQRWIAVWAHAKEGVTAGQRTRAVALEAVESACKRTACLSACSACRMRRSWLTVEAVLDSESAYLSALVWIDLVAATLVAPAVERLLGRLDEHFHKVCVLLTADDASTGVHDAIMAAGVVEFRRRRADAR